MNTETKINEIFSSVQGEGPVVGYKQLFIRFCSCNLKCEYCDTEYLNGEIYTAKKLYEKIITQYNLKTFHSISLTGGEPLLSSEFLQNFLPIIHGKTHIYLETNATLIEEFNKIRNYIDIIAADIKLPSATGMNILQKNSDFIKNCTDKNTFAKIVFDENITKEEINFCTDLGITTSIELILQPKMIGDNMSVTSEFCEKILDKFTSKYSNTRLIPQVHKFLNIR